MKNTETGETQSLGYPFDMEVDAIERAELLNSNYRTFAWVPMEDDKEIETDED